MSAKGSIGGVPPGFSASVPPASGLMVSMSFKNVIWGGKRGEEVKLVLSFQQLLAVRNLNRDGAVGPLQDCDPLAPFHCVFRAGPREAVTRCPFMGASLGGYSLW